MYSFFVFYLYRLFQAHLFTGVGDYVATADPQTFYQTIQSLNVNSSQCRTSTFAAIQKATTVVLSNSIINVFTDSDAKDSNLLDDIIKIVNKKQIRVKTLMNPKMIRNDLWEL